MARIRVRGPNGAVVRLRVPSLGMSKRTFDARVAAGDLVVVGEEPSPPAAQPSAPDLDALRAQAAELGVAVDGRWGAKRLQAEIDAARGG